MNKTNSNSIAQESNCINVQSTQCHICNIPVPTPFIVDHMKSSLHIYNVQIMDITLERSKDFIKANNCDIKSDAEETNDEFCDVCSVSYSYVQKLKHKTSDQHKKLVVYDKIFPKICILLKDVANNLEVIDEIKEVLNGGEKTVNNGNSNENMKVACNNATKEVHQNLKKSFNDKNTSNSDVKDQLINEASNVRIDTQKYSKKKTKHDKNIEETPIVNKDIPIQKIGETAIGLCKINLNQNTVNRKHSDTALNIPKQFPRPKTVKLHTYCDICDIDKCTESHFNSSKHKKKLYKKVLTKNHCDTYIIDTLNDVGKYCKVCKVVLDANNTVEHVENTDHLDKYKKILINCNITKVGNDYFCPTCDIFEHDIVKHVIEKHKTPFLFPYETFCDICRIKIPKRNITLHNIGKVHADNIKGKEERHFKYVDICLEDTDSVKEMVTVVDFGLKCKICDILFYEAPPLMKHIKSDIHNICLKNFYIYNGIETLSDNEYGCNYCQRIITKINVFEHINAEEHKEKMYNELVSTIANTNPYGW